MSAMTLNQLTTLFSNIAKAHDQIQDFAYGELYEIEEKMNKECKYPLLFVSPVSSTTLNNQIQRTFNFLVFDMSNKDKSNVIEAWSDTEQILNDIVKIFRNESNNYELVGDPTLFPFKEDNSDWAIGHRSELVIQTDFNSGYCDIPSDTFISPNSSGFNTVTIKDQNGNVLATITGGGNYNVIVGSGINDDLTATVTIIDQV